MIEKGVDPEDTYNETPYEKGFCFVSYLCSLVGSVEEFDAFLKEYVKKFRYQVDLFTIEILITIKYWYCRDVALT